MAPLLGVVPVRPESHLVCLYIAAYQWRWRPIPGLYVRLRTIYITHRERECVYFFFVCLFYFLAAAVVARARARALCSALKPAPGLKSAATVWTLRIVCGEMMI